MILVSFCLRDGSTLSTHSFRYLFDSFIISPFKKLYRLFMFLFILVSQLWTEFLCPPDGSRHSFLILPQWMWTVHPLQNFL